MKLNTIQPAAGSKSASHRVGRGVGSGWGKTAKTEEAVQARPRLPQSRFRRRPDASASSSAEARLHILDT
mgnify:CR=1 FL=1